MIYTIIHIVLFTASEFDLSPLLILLLVMISFLNIEKAVTIPKIKYHYMGQRAKCFYSCKLIN